VASNAADHTSTANSGMPHRPGTDACQRVKTASDQSWHMERRQLRDFMGL
jgi:hypothetical protein